MALYGTLDSILRYALTPNFRYAEVQARDQDGPDALETLLAEKARCLSDILKDIDADIVSRAALSQRALYLIDQHYFYLKAKLWEMYRWPIDGIRPIENRRGALEKQLDALLQERRAEQSQCWEHVAKLREEFRRWLKQYCDLKQRLRLVLGPASSLRPANAMTSR